MNRYEVEAIREMTVYEKVKIGVQASSKEEALKLAKLDTENYEEIDSKVEDIVNTRWIDRNEWSAIKVN